jgi:hypothetical protein
MSLYPNEYPSPINGGALVPYDWNEVVRRVKGFTPSGSFVSPFTYLILSEVSNGVTYYSANNAFQTIYGGPYWNESPVNSSHKGSGNGIDGTNAALIFQTCLDNGGTIVFNGAFPCSTSLNVTVPGTCLSGTSILDKLTFSGTNGLIVTAISVNIKNCTIENVVAGVYPHTNTGISIDGTSSHFIYWSKIENVDLPGWLSSCYCSYIWESTFHQIKTDYSGNAVTIYGQSVNNFFTNCVFTNYAWDDPTVLITHDTDTGAQPEANNFNNCLMFGGTFGVEIIYGAYTQIGSGCVVDAWSTVGVYTYHGYNNSIANGVWVGSGYSSNICVKFEASTRSSCIGAILYNPSGLGVNLSNTSTNNRVCDNDINAGTGIEEYSTADDYNIYNGNSISGPGAGSNIVVLGVNSQRGTNIPMTG